MIQAILTTRTEDERTIANKLAREEQRQKEPSPESEESRLGKIDPTLPVLNPFFFFWS